MRKLFMMLAAITFASSASAEGTLGGSLNVEVTENVAGDYVATTTLGLGFGAGDVAFGSVDIESVDGATFQVDAWKVGTVVGPATLSFGKQGDLMVENDFEIVGGDTLATLADDHESLQIAVGDAAVMVGLTDITSDVTEVENVQGSYTFNIADSAITAVGDYNLNSEEWTVGSKAGLNFGEVALGGIVTYGSANEIFAYEASAGYSIATAFVNGDQNDALQNVGAGISTTVNGLGVYAEGTYNIDSKDTKLGGGISFSF